MPGTVDINTGIAAVGEAASVLPSPRWVPLQAAGTAGVDGPGSRDSFLG